MKRAVQYVRMSTEKQQYSIDNQMDAIAAYAARHDIEIVRTYADIAKSALSLAGRPALAELLGAVSAGGADFDLILVYDVSRWGRFQDTDEGAHYEFLCKSAGIAVRYCVEQFDDDSLTSSLFKLMKRAMAAEYSRELSVKTFVGLQKIVERGYRAGGTAPYGLRRMLIDQDGAPKCVLAAGQQKNLQSERVTLVPGPMHEVQSVRRIFDLFVVERRSVGEIANILNKENAPIWPGRMWKPARVNGILRRENYIGIHVYNRRTQRLGTKSKANPPEVLIRSGEVFEAIVCPDLFRAAQQRIAERTRNQTDAALLRALSKLHHDRGRLSRLEIHRSRDVPDSTVYRRRFGSLRKAYELIGHRPPANCAWQREDAKYQSTSAKIRHDVLSKILETRVSVRQRWPERTLFEIGDKFTLRIVVVAATRTPNRSPQWRVTLNRVSRPHFVLAARMDEKNSKVLDYYLLPHLEENKVTISLGDSKRARHRDFRMISLKPLLSLCAFSLSGQGIPTTVEGLRVYLGIAAT